MILYTIRQIFPVNELNAFMYKDWHDFFPPKVKSVRIDSQHRLVVYKDIVYLITKRAIS